MVLRGWGMEKLPEGDSNWTAVIARALALLCLKEEGLKGEDLARQALFLERLGISRKEAANLLGTSNDSLRVLMARTQKKGGGRGRSKSTKSK